MNRITATLVSFMMMMGCSAGESEELIPLDVTSDLTLVAAEQPLAEEAPAIEPAEHPAPALAPPALLPALDGEVFSAPRRSWRRLGGNNWQIVSDQIEDPRVTDAREGTRGTCPSGMVQVMGEMRIDPDFDAKQKASCSRWLNRGYPERCADYDETKWQASVAEMDTQPMAFCIDRFEYPNIAGQYPAVVASYRDAQTACAAQGKRVCGEDEWTFACEGEEATPYPNGYDRDSDACSIDAPLIKHDEDSFRPSRGKAGALEIDRLWQGRRSGDSPACKSSFGVHDMTGNVDEWTTSASAKGRRSILKGGYWGRVRARCRPSTRSHHEQFSYYQQGFRCCADLPGPQA